MALVPCSKRPVSANQLPIEHQQLAFRRHSKKSRYSASRIQELRTLVSFRRDRTNPEISKPHLLPSASHHGRQREFDLPVRICRIDPDMSGSFITGHRSRSPIDRPPALPVQIPRKKAIRCFKPRLIRNGFLGVNYLPGKPPPLTQ